MKAVDLYLKAKLPPGFFEPGTALDKKSMGEILARVAREHPELYSDVAQTLQNTGLRASYFQGETLGLEDLAPVVDKTPFLEAMDAAIESLDPGLSKEDRLKRIREIHAGTTQKLDEATVAALKGRSDHGLGMAVLSGSRGSPAQMRAMLTTPGVYTDQKDRQIPFFVRRGFNEGLDPMSYLASAHGTRKAVAQAKKVTAQSGDLCLAVGTLVRMGDGSEKAIEDIVVGDIVLGADTEGNTFPVKVTAVFRQGVKLVYPIHFRPVSTDPGTHGCHEEWATLNHKFLMRAGGMRGSIRPIFERRIHERAAGAATDFHISVGPRGRRVVCRDIEVDHPDHLFVLASGVITSNSKQLSNAAADVIVTQEDCGVSNGVDYGTDTMDALGSVLARDTADWPSGTVIDRSVLGDLRMSGVESVIARSPMTCQARHGICAHCLGTDPRGNFYPIGYAAGITSGHSVGEPLAQGGLRCLEENTLVRMADMSVKVIKDIVPGDWVLGSDIYGVVFPVEVLANHDQGEQPVFSYDFQGRMVESTECHPILSPSGMELKKIHIGQAGYAMVFDLEEQAAALKSLVKSWARWVGPKPCRDLSVDHPDELFVLASGLIVKNTKHESGMGGAKAETAGIDAITRMFQSPEAFPFKAPVASVSGRVESIGPAPQGGTVITIGGEEHYVPPGSDLEVEEGDEIEAGIPLSSGLVDVEDVVAHRGIGEGRRAMVDHVGKVLEASGVTTERRHLETLSRGLVNHMRHTGDEAFDEWLPEDVVGYTDFASRYSPSEKMSVVKPSEAVGRYLEQPALHYTLKTKITPSMAERLERAGFGDVAVSDEPSQFTPEFVRLRTSNVRDKDWLSSMTGSYLKGSLSESAERGFDTNVESNIRWGPRLAYGKNFASDIERTGKF